MSLIQSIGLTVTELSERASRKVLRRFFDAPDDFPDTELDADVEQTEADSVFSTLSPRSTFRAEFLK